MSYLKDLDEYEEQELMNELHRRRKLRDQGLCDYCRRQGITNPCKFPQRHKAALDIRNRIKATLNYDVYNK